MSSILDLDPRWRALMQKSGVIDIGFDHPSDWPHAARETQDFIKVDEDQLTSELCRHGDARAIRVTLALPIRGSDETLYVAHWAEVAQPVFYAYIDLLNGANSPTATLGTLANDLAPLALQDSPIALDFGDGTSRPVAKLEGRDDIGLDDLLALYEAAGTLTRDDLSAQ